MWFGLRLKTEVGDLDLYLDLDLNPDPNLEFLDKQAALEHSNSSMVAATTHLQGVVKFLCRSNRIGSEKGNSGFARQRVVLLTHYDFR